MAAREVIAEFHRVQGAFYAGGPIEPVAALLSPDVHWHVPGTSPIAGDHVGREAVLRYFEQRRRIARATLRMEMRDGIWDADAAVELVDGIAELGGEEVRWRTVGVYRVRDGVVTAGWLVPLDPEQFDRIWSA